MLFRSFGYERISYFNIMKHLALFLLVCCSMGAFAQNWAPFPLDETSEWRVGVGWLTGGGCYVNEQYRYYVSDTVFQQGHEYFEISMSGVHWSQWTNVGSNSCIVAPYSISGTGLLLRAEGGKIYQALQAGEEVLFDFTLNSGDTLFDSIGFACVIDSVDQVDVNGTMCKRMWTVDGNFPEPVWIVENVGHSNGFFFDPIYQFENGGALCYRENGVPILQSEFSNACEILSAPEVAVARIELSPNPSTGIFQIQTTATLVFRIYDLFGRIVLDGHAQGSSEIDLTSHPNGIYLISFESEKGISTAKLVKQ